jgi:hypothetical protein
MSLSLELLGGNDRWELRAGEYRIGRDPTCEICMPPERFAGVSREHAIVTVTASGEVWVQDLQTPNGTYVNGRRVERERLQPGAAFALGKSGPTLKIAGAARAAAAMATVVESQVGALAGPAATMIERSPQTLVHQTVDDEGDEDIMTQRKLDVLRNLVVVTLLLCVGLTVMVVLQQQEIRKNRESLGQMQAQAQNAVGQFMPQLDQRLNHFDGRLDTFNHRMDDMNLTMQQEQDLFVKRLNEEMPRIMDRYIASRASRMGNVQVQGEIR